MQATDLLRFQITSSKALVTELLVDLLDEPFALPTTNGGNHPTWIAGHLAYSESNLIHHMMLGNTNPLIEWKSLFGAGSEPNEEASKYPDLKGLIDKWDEVRTHTSQVLDSLSDDDLDKLAVNPPPGREESFGTYGKIMTMVAQHPLMHRGQLADARRALGRQRLRV